MGIALADIDREVEDVAKAFLARADARGAARRALDADEESLPPFWADLIELGWLGLHLDESVGGQGAGLPQLAVVIEQLGRHVAPGPFLPTVLASAILAEAGSEAIGKERLPGLADGSVVAAVGLTGSLTVSGGTVSGDAGPVAGAGLAQLLVLVAGDDVVVVDRDAAGVTVTARPSLDLTRRAAVVSLDGVTLAADCLLEGARAAAVRLSRTLAAAEAAGLASACTEMAVAYAKEREQFGRTIGTFQAVKHHCANMLVEAEVATATAWDAAAAADRGGPEADLAAAAAAALGLPAALRCAKLNTQVHGGIGYTWEHDCHLYVRRAQALQAAFGPTSAAQEDVSRLTAAGVRRHPTLELPAEADAIRAEVRALADRIRALPEGERQTALVDAGYAFPHWPAPWGRSAGAVEQLVADEELHDLPHPQLGIGGWITQTLATHGTDDQQARWIRQSELGEITWCQLFSEPNAGSDAAGITTKGVRADGGWLVTGQKVWTSGADRVSHGFATVRTNPDAPKHAGVTMMVMEMKAKGLTIRPLRELTGHAQFNEVFFDEVFVPDDNVVGQVDGGWAVARTTLGNERVSIGGGLGGADAAELLPLVAERAPDDTGHLRQIGTFVAQNHALRLLNLRSVARAVGGNEPGPEGNVTKLLTAEHAQNVHELALALYGPDTMCTDGVTEARIGSFLQSRQNTIAGGTSEITRNQIAERLLGLPRDPLLR
ncbi:MAG: acyl-CoA dehydrogenase [Acidobacteria bacterium]|nr:acyl-CoA dehydrogenase [Acidobacteriota bacterium]